MIKFDEETLEPASAASIKVLGIGGAGGNTVNSMIAADFKNIEFIAANTDAQALQLSRAAHKIQLGVKSTKGLGAGANPEIGRRATEEDLDKVLEAIGDADIVFLTAGMGGGTGSGGLPVIAQALHDKGILSIAVITKPFLFEGKRRAQIAENATVEIRKLVDTLLVIPNQKLLELADAGLSMLDAFAMINHVLGQSVRSISDIVTKPGHMNVDFADIRSIMKDMGLAVMGTGCASGPERAQEAALKAIDSPLLENMNIKGAKGVLINISGGPNLGLQEINQAASLIYEEADEDANIILGSVIDESLGDDIVITVIATGFDQRDDDDTRDTSKSVGPIGESLVQEIKPSAPQPAVRLEEAPAQTASVSTSTAESQQTGEQRDSQQDNSAREQWTDNENELDIPTFMRQEEASDESSSSE